MIKRSVWYSEKINGETQLQFIERHLKMYRVNRDACLAGFDPRLHFDSVRKKCEVEKCPVCPMIRRYCPEWVYTFK